MNAATYYGMFFIELGDWVANGCPQHILFDRRTAICRHLVRWTMQRESSTDVHEIYAPGTKLLGRMFGAAGFAEGRAYPFNLDGGTESDYMSYFDELNRGTVYQNPNRVKFVEWAREFVLTKGDEYRKLASS